MVSWLIEPAISLTFFYLAYLLFLQRLPFFQANRFYLLTGIAFSLILPCISVSPPVSLGNYTYFIQEVTVTGQAYGETFPATAAPFNTVKIIMVIYLAGAFLLCTRLIGRLMQIALLVRRNRTRRFKKIRIVSMGSDQSPFSFINCIFINETLYGEEEKKKILEHELVHIRQLHSLDLLLLEFLTIIQWFNPVAWLYRRSMLEVHEYLADEELIRKGTSIPFYQSLLINLQFGNRIFSPANNFNKSLTLSRISMMTRLKPPPWKKIKFFILLPALVSLVIMCTKIEDEVQVIGERTQSQTTFEYNEPISSAETPETGPNTDGLIADSNPDISAGTSRTQDGITSPETAGPSSAPPSGTREETGAGIIPETGLQKSDPDIEIAGNSYEETTPVPPPPPPVPEAGVPEEDITGNKPRNFNQAAAVNEVFFIVEEMPDFRGGGQDAFRHYIADNLRYPYVAAENGIQGRVFVQFVVKADGSVADAKIVRGVDPLLDREALRVVMSSPGWSPGRQRGQPVAVAFTFPINFVLQPRLAGLTSL